MKNKLSLKGVFLNEEQDFLKPTKTTQPTDVNIKNLVNKKIVHDVNKELETYKSVLDPRKKDSLKECGCNMVQDEEPYHIEVGSMPKAHDIEHVHIIITSPEDFTNSVLPADSQQYVSSEFKPAGSPNFRQPPEVEHEQRPVMFDNTTADTTDYMQEGAFEDAYKKFSGEGEENSNREFDKQQKQREKMVHHLDEPFQKHVDEVLDECGLEETHEPISSKELSDTLANDDDYDDLNKSHELEDEEFDKLDYHKPVKGY